MCKKIKKGIEDSIDKILDKYGVDVKVFGHPAEDYKLEQLSVDQMMSIRKVLMKKIVNYEG